MDSDSYRFAGGRVCDNPQVRVDQLDSYVWQSVCELLQNPTRMLDEWSHRQKSDGVPADLGVHRRPRVRRDGKEELLVEAWQLAILGDAEQVVAQVDHHAVIAGGVVGERGLELGGHQCGISRRLEKMIETRESLVARGVVEGEASPYTASEGKQLGGAQSLGQTGITGKHDAEQLLGKTTISVSVSQPTRYVVLHAASLAIESVTARIGSKAIDGSHFYRAAAGASSQAELVLRFRENLPQGTVKLEIVYSALFSRDEKSGLFRVEYDSRWYAFTQFEPTWARRMFPCFDEPAYKTPFELTITTPPTMRAFSNMPEIAQIPTDHGVRFQFAATSPLPTYLVALAVGELVVDTRPSTPVPIRLIRPKGVSVARTPFFHVSHDRRMMRV